MSIESVGRQSLIDILITLQRRFAFTTDEPANKKEVFASWAVARIDTLPERKVISLNPKYFGREQNYRAFSRQSISSFLLPFCNQLPIRTVVLSTNQINLLDAYLMFRIK
ncbi:hypothetical protein [Spirosoma sp.]|uniref:hypothetical protein n=1 Tax=Spirosoma sp. TaxID=1899569 RepID=UPI003B3AEFC2